MPLVRLTCASRTVDAPSPAQVDAILAVPRINNAKTDVTGALTW